MDKVILALSLHVGKWGAERSMCEAMDYLNNNGYHVIMIITKRGSIEELLNNYGIRYYVSPLDTFMIGYHPNFFKRLKCICEILYSCFNHNSKIYNLLKSLRVRPDFVYTNTLLPLNGVFISRHYKAKHIIHIREFMQEDFGFRFILWDKIYLRILNHNVNNVICISKAIYKKFFKYFGKKSVLLYNGVKPPISSSFDKPLNNHNIHMVFIGRLSEEKGIMNFLNGIINVYKQGVNNIHLDIWGTGPLENEIKEIISLNNLEEKVKMCGYSDKIDLTNYDIGIMSSRCEGFGRTTVEYMMSGLAVIGFNGGATPELIDNGSTGLLYHDQDSLIDILKKVSEMTKRNIILMGTNGRHRALSLFHQHRYLNDMLNIFKELS